MFEHVRVRQSRVANRGGGGGLAKATKKRKCMGGGQTKKEIEK
jgi:hypothetical protein